MTLDELVGQLKSAHGNALLGVVLYGSTANDPSATRGHDVLVIVRSLDVTAMRASGAVARAWQEAGNAPPLTLTDAEWRSSVDVFAMEHADIAARNRVVYSAGGFAITEASAVSDADIRAQLEYELLSQLLAVRSAIMVSDSDVKGRRAILAANAGRAVALMRATLRLAGRQTPSDAAAVCAATAELTGFDPAPFIAAQQERRGTEHVSKQDLDRMLGGFHSGLVRLVEFVDGIAKTR